MNVMTEEEAKGRACCGSGNRPAENGPCIASACMAWQWWTATHYRETELWSKSEGRRVASAWEDDAEWRPAGAGQKADPPLPVGFCGLAGRPTP